MMKFLNMFWTTLFNAADAVNEISATTAVMAKVAHDEATGFSDVMKIERQGRNDIATKLAKLALKEAKSTK